MSGIKDFLRDSEVIQYRESYFTARNPTFGTGIAINADPTAIDATESMMTVYNSASATDEGQIWLAPDYIRLTCTAAGTGSTDFKLLMKLDAINRYSSGGTQLTPKSTSVRKATANNGYTDRTPKGTIYFGDITSTAESDAKEVCGLTLASIASATAVTPGDTFTIHFGGGGNTGGTVGVKTATEGHYHFTAAPIFVGAESTLTIHPFQTSGSAASSFEVEIGFYEIGRGRFGA